MSKQVVGIELRRSFVDLVEELPLIPPQPPAEAPAAAVPAPAKELPVQRESPDALPHSASPRRVAKDAFGDCAGAGKLISLMKFAVTHLDVRP